MVDNIREKKLRCILVRRCQRLAMVGMRRDRGRLKKYCGDVIRHDVAHMQSYTGSHDRREIWRSRIMIKGRPFQIPIEGITVPNPNQPTFTSGLETMMLACCGIDVLLK
ncbi:hypothetical protein H5410_033928 [Solanum commersonii]|uniref:Uncharacterized protein n=1 Tax=Solanum commersonii TaxID=4109 RepID=A0A9J5YUJ2_SOLCO|nr:hypothetical protein H5410_033928 [Solanum commersonii]